MQKENIITKIILITKLIISIISFVECSESLILCLDNKTVSIKITEKVKLKTTGFAKRSPQYQANHW